MPTQNYVVRLAPALREAVDARARAERSSTADVVRNAIAAYVAGDAPATAALNAAIARAQRAEAALDRSAAARSREAQIDLRGSREDRFAAALQAAMRGHPATAPWLSDMSGFGRDWCRDLCRALVAAGYAEKIRDGEWVPVPGMDIRKGLEEVRAAAQPGRIGRPPVAAPAAEGADALAGVRQRAAAKGAPLVAAKDLPARPPRKLAAQRAVREAAEAGSPRLPRPAPDGPPGAPVFRAGPDVDCAHENMRGIKGVCPDCKQWVTK